jgi:hypothetical protein
LKSEAIIQPQENEDSLFLSQKDEEITNQVLVKPEVSDQLQKQLNKRKASKVKKIKNEALEGNESLRTRKTTPKEPLDNSRRVEMSQVSAKIDDLFEIVIQDKSHYLPNYEAIKGLEPAFAKGVKKFSNLHPLPKIAYNLDPFEKNPDAKHFLCFQQQVCEAPHQYWPELLDLLESIFPPDIRTSLYKMIQVYMPLKSGSNKGWFANNREKGVCSSLFPYAYRTGEHYDRLFPKRIGDLPKLDEKNRESWEPSSVLYGTHRSYKTFLIRILNRLMKENDLPFLFLEVDIASCHARVVASLFKEQTPNLNRVFSEGTNLWSGIILALPPGIVSLINIHTPVKGIVKIVAYKVLQTGLLNFKHVFKAIHEFLFNLSEGEIAQVVNAFVENEVIQEFRALFAAVERKIQYGNPVIYGIFSENPLIYDPSFNKDEKITAVGRTNNSFRLCSSALVSIESYILLMMIQVFSEKGNVIPISLEHDGCLWLVNEREKPFDIQEYDEYLWSNFVKKVELQKMSLEVKTL